ncbi:MAG: hypothetical protein G01um101472_515 [Parcubacteria group bacterium Gr01-1014_72]|nr:MAG: hypothetical protein G01um101472_515 [Parcubacteria group bacterium Gr01-1014_72]
MNSKRAEQYQRFERTLKAVSNRRRLAILAFLKREKEASVGHIAGEIRLSLKATSKHLTVLSSVEIVSREQRSSQMFYSIAPGQTPVVQHIISLL